MEFAAEASGAGNASKEPNASAAGVEPSLEGREYSPASFNQEMARLEGLSKTLDDCQQRLNDASSRSLLLNVDIVTQFDPHVAAELRRVVEECERCAGSVRREEGRVVEGCGGDSVRREEGRNTQCEQSSSVQLQQEE